MQHGSAENNREILHHGDGPDQLDMKMFQLALMRLKQDGDKLVQDVHWTHYPSDNLLHNNIEIIDNSVPLIIGLLIG